MRRGGNIDIGRKGTTPLVVVITLGLLTASAITNLTLIHRVRRLEAIVTAVKEEHSLHAGERVPSETLESVSGKRWVLSYSQSAAPTILYIFAPHCDWCRKNIAGAAEVATQTYGRYRFVGVSLSGAEPDLREYLEANHIRYPVYVAPRGFALDYLVAGTPTTILVSARGRVMKTWNGAYFGDTARAMETDLGVHIASLSVGRPGNACSDLQGPGCRRSTPFAEARSAAGAGPAAH